MFPVPPALIVVFLSAAAFGASINRAALGFSTGHDARTGRPSSSLQQAGAPQAAPIGPGAPALDFETFRTRVQPIFLNRRKGHARCYACHSQGTAFRLQ